MSMVQDVAELVRYVRWAGGTRGGRRYGTHPFRDLVHRARRPQDRGPEMAEARWRRMLGEPRPGVDLHGPRERGRRTEGPGCRCCGSCCRGRGGTEGGRGHGAGERGGSGHGRETQDEGKVRPHAPGTETMEVGDCGETGEDDWIWCAEDRTQGEASWGTTPTLRALSSRMWRTSKEVRGRSRRQGGRCHETESHHRGQQRRPPRRTRGGCGGPSRACPGSCRKRAAASGMPGPRHKWARGASADTKRWSSEPPWIGAGGAGISAWGHDAEQFSLMARTLVPDHVPRCHKASRCEGIGMRAGARVF